MYGKKKKEFRRQESEARSQEKRFYLAKSAKKRREF
jgi:hypothetical protein